MVARGCYTTMFPRRSPLKQPQLTEMARRVKEALDPQVLKRLGESSGFVERERIVTAEALAVALLCALACGRVETLADLHRSYMAMTGRPLRYKPFHNQLAKPQFPEFMQRVLMHLVASLAMRVLAPVPGSVLSRFSDILLQDGSSLAVHGALASVLPGRFKAVSPAAVELHATMSVLEDRPVRVTLAPDTEGERQFLPAPESLLGKLVMADRGYEDTAYCRDVAAAGGSFIIRFKGSLNPKIRLINVPETDPLYRLQGQKLKKVRSQLSGRDIDLDVVFKKCGTSIPLRVVLVWNPEFKEHMVLATNISREEATVATVRTLYRLRWQVELLFKEWKSYANLHRFATTKEPITVGLMWAAIGAATLKRFIAHATQRVFDSIAISTRTTAMACTDLLRDVLRVRHHARRFRDALRALVEHLGHVARRAHPKRERIRGRLAAGLEPVTAAAFQ